MRQVHPACRTRSWRHKLSGVSMLLLTSHPCMSPHHFLFVIKAISRKLYDSLFSKRWRPQFESLTVWLVNAFHICVWRSAGVGLSKVTYDHDEHFSHQRHLLWSISFIVVVVAVVELFGCSTSMLWLKSLMFHLHYWKHEVKNPADALNLRGRGESTKDTISIT